MRTKKEVPIGLELFDKLQWVFRRFGFRTSNRAVLVHDMAEFEVAVATEIEKTLALLDAPRPAPVVIPQFRAFRIPPKRPGVAACKDCPMFHGHEASSYHPTTSIVPTGTVNHLAVAFGCKISNFGYTGVRFVEVMNRLRVIVVTMLRQYGYSVDPSIDTIAACWAADARWQRLARADGATTEHIGFINHHLRKLQRSRSAKREQLALAV